MADFDEFRALSFDCYGTLIDWETGITAQLRQWATAHGVDVTDADLLAAFGRFETGVETEHPTALYPDVLAMTLDRISDHFGVIPTDEDRASFGGSVGSWPAFPDSAEALARLKQRFRLIILSNIDRTWFAASNERLGVEFDLILTAQDIGSYKPDGRNFSALLEGIGTIGVSKDQLLHVAESLYHDHEPAIAAGLPSVWIHRRHEKEGHGATAPPSATVQPRWRFTSMAAFADAAT
jgi:2-haloalkanoic acid dehalogenase type II